MFQNRLLFVVHRYYPFPGGSEYYVRNMAEEALKRGWDVTVLAHEHKGDQNGVKVTNDYNILKEDWALIVVHGGDCISQNVVHLNADKIGSPVLFMLIKPSETPVCMNGLINHNYIGYSTKIDIDFCRKYGVLDKARRVRHGIPLINPPIHYVSSEDFNMEKIFVSAGGFYPHKGMTELADIFAAKSHDAYLRLFGYSDHPIAADPSYVSINRGKSQEEVLSAINLADGYIMNSFEEGFGLVLLEAMMMKTPWFARKGVGAVLDLERYGVVYENELELIDILNNYKRDNEKVEKAYEYVMSNHTIQNTVDDIEDILIGG